MEIITFQTFFRQSTTVYLSIYIGIIHINLYHLMNKLFTTYCCFSTKRSLTLPQFNKMLKDDPQTMVVEIGKDPSMLLKKSLWIGYRNGGMSSWLSSLMPHLPYKRFCLYMDEENYRNSEYMYSYYTDYHEKLFHSSYSGTFIYPRHQIDRKLLYSFDEIQAQELSKTLMEQSTKTCSVILDLRGAEAAQKDNVKELVQEFNNAQYINLPLNDDDLVDQLLFKTSHLPDNCHIITICAKGYRSLIGYSFLKLINHKNWKIRLCRNTVEEIRTGLKLERMSEKVLAF